MGEYWPDDGSYSESPVNMRLRGLRRTQAPDTILVEMCTEPQEPPHRAQSTDHPQRGMTGNSTPLGNSITMDPHIDGHFFTNLETHKAIRKFRSVISLRKPSRKDIPHTSRSSSTSGFLTSKDRSSIHSPDQEAMARHEAWTEVRADGNERNTRSVSPSRIHAKKRIRPSGRSSLLEMEEVNVNRDRGEEHDLSFPANQRLSVQSIVIDKGNMASKVLPKSESEHAHGFATLLDRVRSKLSRRRIVVNRDIEKRPLLWSHRRREKRNEVAEGENGRVRASVDGPNCGETIPDAAVRPTVRFHESKETMF